MKELTADEMILVGGGPCGGAWSSIAVESTFMAAAGFVGFGLSMGNPGAAIFSAGLGLKIGGLICRSS